MNKLIPPNIYHRKFNGYRCSHRNRWYLVQYKILTLSELSLFDFYVDVSDFDIKHDTFSQFEVDFMCLAQIFDCSVSTIRYRHNQLIKVGLIQKSIRRSYYQIVNPKRYSFPGIWRGESSTYSKAEKNQPVEKIFQSIGINFQHSEEKSQSVEKNSLIYIKPPISKALASSKGESSFVSNLPIDDLEWINNHVGENER